MDSGGADYIRFLSGDDDAFVEIIRQYKNGLIFYLDTFTHNLDAAEDLMEDTFVKIVTKKPVFRANSSFKTWLYAIGSNVARDWLRKNRRAAMVVSMEDLSWDLAAQDNLERDFFQRENWITLRKALRTIQADYARVLYLVYFEGFSNEQAAKIMGKSKRQVENLLYRGKHSLKAELERKGFSYEGV